MMRWMYIYFVIQKPIVTTESILVSLFYIYVPMIVNILDVYN
jgi:hypothetical protein